MISIDLNKQQAHDVHSKAIQKINFAWNLNRKDNQARNINDNTTMLFITEELKETILETGVEVTLKLSSSVACHSNDENNFPRKLLLTNTQVSKLRKAFANNSLASIKLSKTQLHKIGQSGGFLGRLLGSLLKTGLPLMKNV